MRIRTLLVATGAALVLAGCSTASASSPAANFSAPAGSTTTAQAAASAPASASPATAAASAAWNSPAHIKSFFAEISQGAISAMGNTGIPASVLMALAGQESGFGTSYPATAAHNLFAQACGNAPNCVGKFLKYKDWTHSLQDFASRMAGNQAVQAVLQVAPGDAQQIAGTIAGLRSVDPQFAQKVTGLISQYHLSENDHLGG